MIHNITINNIINKIETFFIFIFYSIYKDYD
jgi:hypothetical protein